jgi:hypothetical protein
MICSNLFKRLSIPVQAINRTKAAIGRWTRILADGGSAPEAAYQDEKLVTLMLAILDAAVVCLHVL